MSDIADAVAVQDVVCQFELSSADLQRVTNHFVSQLKTGLLDSSLPFQLPTFITSVPNGSETGRFLSVDLGGTNCRICLVDLLGHGACSVAQTKHAVPRALMVHARHEPLFSWLAACIRDFVQEHALFSDFSDLSDTLLLGFTFSFTCNQTSLSSGTLLHWDKGWDLPSALGRDPCRLLQDALDAAAVPVRVAALANDSVGTLLARAYTAGRGGSSRTLAGLIVGTGTNAAYVERLQCVQRYAAGAAAAASPQDVMLVNTEWGCLDDGLHVLPQTRFDVTLDTQSIDPGAQMLEKRVAGMYLGELFRLATAELHRHSGVFHCTAAADAPLFQQGGADSSLLSLLADATLDRASQTASVASALGLHGVSPLDMHVLQRVAAAVMTRAARLTGAALAAIVLQSGRLSNASPLSSSSSPSFTPKTPILPKKSLPDQLSTFLCRLFPCWRRWRHAQNTDIPSLASSTRSENIIDIGITGSVIELHPTFEAEMRAALHEIEGIGREGEKRIQTGICSDGSAVGAALMAQAAMSTYRD